MTTGKRLGVIVDVIVTPEGTIKSLILEEKRIKSFLIFGLRYDKVVNSSKFYLYHDRLDHRYSQ